MPGIFVSTRNFGADARSISLTPLIFLIAFAGFQFPAQLLVLLHKTLCLQVLRDGIHGMPQTGAGVDEAQQILRVGAVLRGDGHKASCGYEYLRC